MNNEKNYDDKSFYLKKIEMQKTYRAIYTGNVYTNSV